MLTAKRSYRRGIIEEFYSYFALTVKNAYIYAWHRFVNNRLKKLVAEIRSMHEREKERERINIVSDASMIWNLYKIITLGFFFIYINIYMSNAIYICRLQLDTV